MVATPDSIRNLRGFSLLELMLVVTIIAIMTGVSLPMFGSMRDRQALEQTTRTFATLIQYMRSEALQGSRNTRIQWDAETMLLETLAETAPLEAPGQFEAIQPPISVRTLFNNDIRIVGITKSTLVAEEPDNQINFSPEGSTSDTMIYLSNDEERVYTIGIVGLTGQVLVWMDAVETFYDAPSAF